MHFEWRLETCRDVLLQVRYCFLLSYNLKGNNIVLATAHPCKFPGAIQSAINVKAELPNELTFVLDQKENYDIVENDIEKVKQHIKDRT